MKRILFGAALAFAVAATSFMGYGAEQDAISQAEKIEQHRPGILETKAIAEEGFIYGLPIVMNYAVIYEFWVDKTSGQYKCPFNQLYNEHRVFTLPGHRGGHAQQRHARIRSRAWTCAPSRM